MAVLKICLTEDRVLDHSNGSFSMFLNILKWNNQKVAIFEGTLPPLRIACTAYLAALGVDLDLMPEEANNAYLTGSVQWSTQPNTLARLDLTGLHTQAAAHVQAEVTALYTKEEHHA
jgi:hypothetical protein